MILKYLSILSVLVFHTFETATAVCPHRCACSTTADDKKQVHCANQQLSHIPSSISRDVAYLDLRGNRIEKVTKETFAGFTNLEVLYLDDNLIYEIGPLSFQDLKKVELISLRNNRLSKLSERAFAFMEGHIDCYNGSKSCNLDLGMNDIEVIESNSFAWIMRLNILIGESKGTTTLKPHSFYGAKHIPSIQIRNITKLHLEKHWLSETDGIGILHISSCDIQTVVPFLFEGTNKICMMMFENNSFNTIRPYGFSGIKFASQSCVHRLKQTGLNLAYRPDEHTNALPVSLKVEEKSQVDKSCGGIVIFKNCVMPTLSTDMFRDTNVEEIELKNSRIKKLEANVFRGLDCLQHLYVTDNTIETGLSSGSFGALNNIRDLIFNNNELITIHDHAFQGTQQVKRLVFLLKPNKNFSLSPHALSGLTDIETIEITGCQSDTNFLMLHSSAFDELVGVINITISNVHIPQLSEHAFRGIGKVHSLSFVDVKIDHFSSKAFNSVPVRTPISSFLITGDDTGINCDCDTLREVFDLNYMFEKYTIMCSADVTSDGSISQRQTLSSDLMQLKNCKYGDRTDSSVNSANKVLGSVNSTYKRMIVMLIFLNHFIGLFQ